MATGTDPYAPIREAAHETTSPTPEPPASEEINRNQTAVERTVAAHETRDAAARIDQYGQPTHWPIEQNMDAQNMAALQLIKDRHMQREKVEQEAERSTPEPQKGEARRELSFFEDRQPHDRDYGKLKLEHTQDREQTANKEQDKDSKQGQSLSFFEGRNHTGLDRSR